MGDVSVVIVGGGCWEGGCSRGICGGTKTGRRLW